MTKMILKLIRIALFLTMMLLHYLGFAQYEIPKKPDFQTSLYDYANLLSENQKQELENKLVRFSDTTSTQIVIVTIEDLKGEDVGVLATNWAHKWGIGQGKLDNGIILLVSKNDRKLSIRNGYGLEQYMTAGTSGEIIRNDITPFFKQQKYYEGLNAGVDAIFKVIKGSYKGTRIQEEPSILPLIIFLLFFILLLFLISKGNKNNGGNGTGNFSGPDLMDIIILSRMGRGGGSFGSGGFGGSSGGGFGGGSGGFGGGFGGGGFSGGGASGSW